jgi:hypothetical protein
MREVTHEAVKHLSSTARQIYLKWSDGSISAYIITYDQKGRPTYGQEMDVAAEPVGLNWIPVEKRK